VCCRKVIRTSQLSESARVTKDVDLDSLVDPKVRDTVDDGDLCNASLVCPEAKQTERDGKTEIRGDNVPELSVLEDD
jgi:hypothetical protein